MSDYQYNPDIEQWKAIPGFPGYEVSDQGKVRSYWKRVRRPKGSGSMGIIGSEPKKIMKPMPGSHGYHRAAFRKEGKCIFINVCRLVLSAFVGPCPPGMEACHNDGNNTNDWLTNLRWDTHKNNSLDTVAHGKARGAQGEKHSRAKLTNSDVRKIRSLYKKGFSKSELTAMYPVDFSNISRIVDRITWRHLP